jgi:hypothetical protein
MFLKNHILCGLILVLTLASFGYADENVISAEDRAFFEKKIRPVLVKHCYECHAEDSKELGGKLLLDSRSGMLKGGESGPSVIAEKPDESIIIQALRYDSFEMPPEEPLSEAVINDFVYWVSQGAPDPRVKEIQKVEIEPLDPETLWSFYPRKQPETPEVKLKDWSRDPLDDFILSKLEKAELQPTNDASPRTLIRRLYNDLIGLPPTIEQVSNFETDYQQSGKQATERLVDELLNRPQFGERWGRHWLDVARYGESNGNDGLGRNATFPHAWRYRDYVIDAINEDRPYDQFITEQIAGDLLPATTAEQRNRQLIATGFLAIGSKPALAMNKNFAMDIVDDQINAVSTAIMGLSVACARCHDHKHDPIPTKDYYALAGIFSNTESLYGLAGNEKLTASPTELHSLRSEWNPQDKVASDLRKGLKFSTEYDQTVADLKPDIHERLIEKPEQLKVESDVKYSEKTFAEVKTATLSGHFPSVSKTYSVSLWFKNETNNSERPITAYLFSHAKLGDKTIPGDHLGIGGNHDKNRTGKLFVFNGNKLKKSIAGSTVIEKGTWNHVILVRNENQIRVHLNGVLELEGELSAGFGETLDFCVANRSENFAPLVGNIADFSLFTRALSPEEIVKLHTASGQPKGTSPPYGLAMGVREKQKIENCKVHINGDIGKLGPLVERGTLTAYEQVSFGPQQSFPQAISISEKTSGRLELSQWLTHPEHPQTARVLVNRVWLHLFGRGIVSTPDDFGVYGARPTHPELLDHLSNRIIDEGWSLKRFIRSIVLSRTYQLDSAANESLVHTDPENTLYGRHSRRRLDAESLRDSILQASGNLNLSRPVGSEIDEIDALINKPDDIEITLHQPSLHRSIYLSLLRHSPPPELAAFDLPDGVTIVGQRDETTLPTQSLFLFNNPFVVSQSEALAKKILAQAELNEHQRISKVFQQVLTREPSKYELEQAIQFVGDSPDEVWTSLVQALLATNEFRYID